MIIDFHTHTFPKTISKKVVSSLAMSGGITPYTEGSLDGLHDSMDLGSIDYSINLPVMTNPEQVEKIHNLMIDQKEDYLKKGIIPFGGMHPDYTDYKKELLRLKNAGICGIKLHPAYQTTDLDDIRMLRIIDHASTLGLTIVVHAGIDVAFPAHNYSSVKHVLSLLGQVKPNKLVLAHMGNWGCWDEVESDLCGAPLWFDTAMSIGEIKPYEKSEKPAYNMKNLSNADFIRIVKKHGCNRVLFATDSPWQDQSSYVDMIQNMDFTDQEKNMIFSDNAISLLDLPLQRRAL